jgi:hypothetical protein
LFGIEYYSDFLDNEQHSYVVEKTLFGRNWSFQGKSDDQGFNFWYMELIEDEFFSNFLFKKIENITGKKFKLDRVYANGQTHGLSGSLHQDTQSTGSKTFLYYVNPFWGYEWAGQTIFVKDNDFHTINFIPNTGVLFDSNLYHAGLEPSRHCKKLRVTVAFKMSEIEKD